MSSFLIGLKKKLQRQANDTRKNLQFILIGFALALLGIALIMGGEFLFQHPVERELVALFGILFVVLGCLLTAVGYISMSILRIIYFVIDKTEDDKK